MIKDYMHHMHQELIDTFSDREVIELWFDYHDCCEASRDDGMRKTIDIAKTLALHLFDVLPNNRLEKMRALVALQEVMFWSCAGIKRAHAVSNILQKRRGERELTEMGLTKEKIEEMKKEATKR